MTAIGTYRKCYKCGCITNNVEAIKCECGGFLYLISQIYMPKAAKEQQKEKAIKANGSRVRKLQEFIKVAKRQLEREEKEASNE